MHYRISTFIFFLLLSIVNVCNIFGQAHTQIHLYGTTQKLDSIHEDIWVLKDNEFTIDQASQKLPEFTKGFHPEKLNPKNSYWCYLPLSFGGNTSKKFTIAFGAIDRASIYIKSEGGVWETFHSGWTLPKSKRNISIGEITEVQFPLTLQPQTNYQCLVKITNPTHAPFRANPIIESSNTWQVESLQKLSVKNLVLGIACGLLGIMFFYNMLVFVFSKQKIYFFYAVYIGMGVVYILNFAGLFLEYLFPETPASYLFFRSMPPTLGFMGYVKFAQLFLDTKTKFPSWHKVLNVLIYVTIAMAVLIVSAIPFTLSQTFTRQIPSLWQLIAQLTMLIFVIRLFISRQKLAQYFAIGALLFTSASVFLGYVAFTNAMPLIIGLAVEFTGLAGELIAFSLGLGYKIKLTEDEKIAAQNKTAKILQEQNELLETRVAKRTHEISQQKEEILTQNEELQQQHEEIVSQRDYIEAQNSDLRHKNSQITNSIRYAQTIQAAILPFHKKLEQEFAEYLIFYKPKDIVSGDFYWFEKIGDTRFLAIVDCTGHGVPGGFMSMIGFSLLNEIVVKQHTRTPSEILDKLNEGLIQALQQNDTDAINRDGMDIALCAIQEDSNEQFLVSFAGAKRPLYFTQGETDDLLQLKGDRKSIGGYQPKNKAFTNHTMLLPKGSSMYLTTDGFADQNNHNGKKFGSPALRKLLQTIQAKPMNEQEKHLEQTFKQHTGNQPQRDDVALIGIKL